jgi:hypothetical protein
MGFTGRVIDANVERGLWQRLHRRVYATFSGPVPRVARIWAAVLAAGDGAAVSHHTAGELAGLVDFQERSIHVSVPDNRRVSAISGVVLHRSSRLAVACHSTRLPRQTRLEETVLDLADLSSDAGRAIAWCATACGRRLTTPLRLSEALAERSRHRWRSELVAALGDIEAGCQSPLEIRYLRRVERPHGLPASSRQVQQRRFAGHIYDDVNYRLFGVVVELDGRVAHPAESRFCDLERDNVAGARGDVVLHYGWADVSTRPCEVAWQVAEVLRARGWSGRPTPCRHLACKILESPPPHR